jgi:predicted ferric reductase
MAQAMSAHSERSGIWSVLAALAVAVPTGYLVARVSLPITHNRYFPWIAGRTLGLAAYLALAALVVLGIWLRHPWSRRWPLIHPEARLRLHASLGVATCILLGGHIAALASDRYAGVGWPRTLVPGASSYRTVAVTLGVVGFYFLVAITTTAALGGRLVGRHWLIVHRLAMPTFLLGWFHGVLAGSDTTRLRVVYAVSGAVVGVLMFSRAIARTPLRVDPRPIPTTGPGSSELAATGLSEFRR